MTNVLLNLSNSLPKGLTYAFNPPCASTRFNKEVLNNVFKNELPKVLGELQQIWSTIPMGRFTGLAPIAQQGPIDNCSINGNWSPEHQRAHGGALPIMGGVPGSRGIPEIWKQPTTQWEEVSFGIWANKQPKHLNFQNETNWAQMNWCGNQTPTHTHEFVDDHGGAFAPSVSTHSERDWGNRRPPWSSVGVVENASTHQDYFYDRDTDNHTTTPTPTHLRNWPGNKRLKPDGSARKRGQGTKHNHRRGGKSQVFKKKNPKDKADETCSAYFANPSSFSDKAKMHLLHGQHNVILLAETHKYLKQTLQLIFFKTRMGYNRFTCTSNGTQ